MKLRSRSKVIRIKPEPNEETVVEHEAISSEKTCRPGTNSSTTRVKQEDTTISISETNQAGFPPRRDFYYHCRICDQEMPSFEAVHQHREDVHSIHNFRYSGKGILHVDLDPDVSDPNFYCKPCEKTIASKKQYRGHLRQVHHMKLLDSAHGPKNNSVPNPDDPNSYCRTCEKRYETPRKYRSHLRSSHKMKLPKLAENRPKKNPDILPDWYNADNYCRSCERTLPTAPLFRAHCKMYHYMRPPASECPDSNDPNFYCRPCEKKFPTNQYYFAHLRSVHGSEQKLFNPDFYCHTCATGYKNAFVYRTHCKTVHKTHLSRFINPNGQIDPNSSTYFCAKCDRHLKHRYTFMYHLRNIHRMDLSLKQLGTPDDSIDINHPENYCVKCDKNFYNKTRFFKHLTCIHSMALILQQNPNPVIKKKSGDHKIKLSDIKTES